jgi:predicted ATP-grasp superfamily ATP-dependent carboligase
MSVTSRSAELIRDLPHNSTSLDIPGGMAAVLDHWLTERGIPCIGLWAQVPHYVSAMSFPAASVTLLRAVESISGLAVDVGPLEQEAMVQRNRIEELVQGNDEHRAMVRQLEALYDREQPDLPSSDELAAEVERFLRDQGDQ